MHFASVKRRFRRKRERKGISGYPLKLNFKFILKLRALQRKCIAKEISNIEENGDE